MSSTNTIFALATPPGRSAIAVIRISGPLAGQAPGLFDTGCPDAGEFQVARLWSSGNVIDEALILYMRAPKSSTGEDVCEIHCHGSSAVVSVILEKLGDSVGFRLAEPGEFSRRAFINDKMDLLGVEGLADVIDAETPAQLYQAQAQINGALRGPVERWRKDLIFLLSSLDALIDFADEDLPDSIETQLRQQTKRLIKDIANTLDDQRVGELIRGGVIVALIGSVNVGKSTILNGLIGRSAAIVSDKAGTTRDVISVQLDIEGVPVTIQDTAGIRDTVEPIEVEGIRRTMEVAQNADVVVFVVDVSDVDWLAEIGYLSECIKQPDLIVMNKVDKGFSGLCPAGAMLMSAQNDTDITILLSRLGELITPRNHVQKSTIITRVRHRRALQETYDCLCAGLKKDFYAAPELVAEDFRRAAAALGRVTGEVDVEELLEQIFSSFCIGK